MNITPPMLWETELFEDAALISNHDTITCYQLACFPVKCSKQVFFERSTTFPVICCRQNPPQNQIISLQRQSGFAHLLRPLHVQYQPAAAVWDWLPVGPPPAPGSALGPGGGSLEWRRCRQCLCWCCVPCGRCDGCSPPMSWDSHSW